MKALYLMEFKEIFNVPCLPAVGSVAGAGKAHRRVMNHYLGLLTSNLAANGKKNLLKKGSASKVVYGHDSMHDPIEAVPHKIVPEPYESRRYADGISRCALCSNPTIVEQIYLAYRARFDIEHFFRFGKQKLLLTQFQTPDVEREEKWWYLNHLAFAQLWLARHLTTALPRPWERNLPAMKKRLNSPTLVQRGFA